MTRSPRKSCFPPIADDRARILILGTLPGDESLRKQQYYGHPQNQFWRIVYDCFGDAPHANYDDRGRHAQSKRIAIWDVLASATRDGSLDTAIKDAAPNDFAAFFATHKNIRAIGFNGQKAHALFMRHFGRANAPLLAQLVLIVLPSTSPAAALSYQEKLIEWSKLLHQPSQSIARRTKAQRST